MAMRGQGVPSPDNIRGDGVAGQGSSEYIVLLGVGLAIALVVVGLLMYHPGTSNDTKKAQSDLYWKTAYPIAILESTGAITGCTSRGCPDHQDSAKIIVKNLDTERVILKGLWLNNYAGDILDQGGNYLCSMQANNATNCSIALPPGKTYYLEPTAGYASFCNDAGGTMGGGSWNSIQPQGEATVIIYYGRSAGGSPSAETSSTKLELVCGDYWICSDDKECNSRYGGTLSCSSLSSTGAQGGCFETGE